MFLFTQLEHVTGFFGEKNPRKRRWWGCVPKVESALWVASEHGHLKVVQLLIDAEAHVDTCHSDDIDGQKFGAGIIRFFFELARG